MEKTYEIRSDQSIELLKELHILTRDQKLNQDSRRKLKQIYHLTNFIEPIIQTYENKSFTLIDHGAGKSYLGFILYDLIIKNTLGKIIGVEINDELVNNSNQLMQKFKFSNISFMSQDIASSNETIKNAEIVTALHACDTATDDAIDFALQKNADWLVVIPCCQAEVYQHLKKNKSKNLNHHLVELYRHGIHSREFGSLLTNILRCLKLEYYGFKVTVTELVGWEHSMKNEIIIAENLRQKKPSAGDRIEKLLADFDLSELQSRFLNI
ncbi:SAM-dependent methyltransferase [Methylophilaceae bacterium]|nr:SAM-dependent methyltransferase [Methylophilaceae bacterium]